MLVGSEGYGQVAVLNFLLTLFLVKAGGLSLLSQWFDLLIVQIYNMPDSPSAGWAAEGEANPSIRRAIRRVDSGRIEFEVVCT